ncbi:flagellar basal body rod protein FlgB [Blastopirellula marina]|uniref:Flagellar basal body rod protein FlgB n=1 Tax=Blastopirellula marina TaxID=124 RepID=A0A2S8FCP7_9BACT|nr:flagellar basal body rod protein FlgB [Blastopirellula marina]PQO29919.1 flagellar basal body rod protein FlgB [Blastopirellula marina]PTL42387.1 flagellar basal body rod protein FlgB [Blastopirellula marina]
MESSILNANTTPVLEQVVNFAQKRHSILATNIANQRVPGYKGRDLNLDRFQEVLAEAIEQKNHPNEEISPGVVTTKSGDPMREVRESLNGILFHDESNLDIEKQVAELTKNQVMHNMALTIMEDQFNLLNAAISERI